MVGDTVRGSYAAAHEVMERLAAVGVDYDDVVQQLEDEGVEKFEASWQELATSMKSELERLRPAADEA